MKDIMKKRSFKRIFAFCMSIMLVMLSFNFSAVDVFAAKTKVVKAKSVTFNKKEYILQKGKTVKLTATVKPAKSTQKKLVWSTSNKKVATVNSKGVVKGIKNGTATITVKVKGTKLKATCKIKVCTLVTRVIVPKKTVNLTVGDTYKVKPTVSPKNASNKNVSYKSSKKSVASVSEKGVITAKKVGTTYITVKAKDGSGKSAKIKVVVKKVTPADVKVTKVTVNVSKNTLDVGENITATVNVEPDNATNKSVTWKSSNEAVAIVDANGKITAKATGTAIITTTANDGSGKSGTVLITVKQNIIAVNSVTITPSSADLETGDTKQLSVTITPNNATNKAIIWSSSNSAIVSVDSNGKITAKAEGTATITASVDGGKKKAEAIITVKPVSVKSIVMRTKKLYLVKGETKDVKVNVLPQNSENKNLIFTSSNPEVANVTETGKVIGVNLGKAVITAKTEDGNVKAECQVEVRSVTITAFMPDDVQDECNNIHDYKFVEWETAEDIETVFIIYGVNPTITNLSFSFDEYSEISGEYEEIAGSAVFVGKLTVTKNGYVQEFKVKYVQKMPERFIRDIKDSVNAYKIEWCEYGTDEDRINNKELYNITGTKNELDGAETYKFYSGIHPESYTLREVTGKEWNYELDIVYNGMEETVYINYKKDMSFLVPNYGRNYDYSEDFALKLVESEGEWRVQVTGCEDNYPDEDWDDMIFTTNFKGVTYKVEQGDNIYYLVIDVYGREKARYPIYYKVEVDVEGDVNPEIYTYFPDSIFIKMENTEEVSQYLELAEERREEIWNSDTEIVKSDTFIRGETYTGIAYYVSPDGDDNNSGLSPEEAWKSLDQVSRGRHLNILQPGDAVFFERGGTWAILEDTLWLAEDVTYSAYGEGDKPVFTIVQENSAVEEYWELYYSDDSGMKIWKYHTTTTQPGGIVFDGGESYATRVWEHPTNKGWEQVELPYLKFPEERYFGDATAPYGYVGTGVYPNVEENMSKDKSFIWRTDLSNETFPIDFYQGLGHDYYGDLYVRCDSGNPGNVYEEVAVIAYGKNAYPGVINAWDVSGYVLDNLCVRYFMENAIGGCVFSSDMIVQNCWFEWGGTRLHQIMSGDSTEGQSAIGDGIYCVAANATIRNNYVGNAGNGATFEDCHDYLENMGHYTVSGNLFENCGQGILLGWLNKESKYESIDIVDNIIMSPDKYMHTLPFGLAGIDVFGGESTCFAEKMSIRENVLIGCSETLLAVTNPDFFPIEYKDNVFIQDFDKGIALIYSVPGYPYGMKWLDFKKKSLKPIVTAVATENEGEVFLDWQTIKQAGDFEILIYDGTNFNRLSNANIGEKCGVSEYLATGLAGGVEYGFLVRTYSGEEMSDYTLEDVVYVTTKGSSKPVVSATAGDGCISFSWDEVYLGEDYDVSYYNDNGTITPISNTYGNTNFEIGDLVNGKEYKFIVRTYVGGSWTSYTEEDVITVVPNR